MADEALQALDTVDISRLSEVQRRLNRGVREIKNCFHCRKKSETNLSICGSCKQVAYCNRECQRADWTEHKKECKLFQAKKAEAKAVRRQFKGETGRSRCDNADEIDEHQQMVEGMEGFYSAFRRITHMICMGGNIPEIGTAADKPSQCLFRVNTTALQVFQKSKFPDLQRTVIFTACPLEYSEFLLSAQLASELKSEYANKDPLDMENGGCNWFIKPDRWKASQYIMNAMLFLPFAGTRYWMPKGMDSDEAKAYMKAMWTRNKRTAKNLGLNRGLIPWEIARLATEDLEDILGVNGNAPNWEALASSEEFNSIVSSKPFGIIYHAGNPSSNMSITTMFMNIDLTNLLCTLFDSQIE